MTTRVLIAGAAGLVGQNLIAILARSDVEINGVDKTAANKIPHFRTAVRWLGVADTRSCYPAGSGAA